jgi:hypothetical protein
VTGSDTVGAMEEQPRSRRLAQTARLIVLALPHRGPSRWSIGSDRSVASVGSSLSIASVGSWLSLASVGSILSIGSSRSILSIGSSGSILSIGSTNAVFSIGATSAWRSIGHREPRDEPPPDDGVVVPFPGSAA